MVNDEKFRCIVKADAKAIINRQETDSIDIIDEIRYVLKTQDLESSKNEAGSFTVRYNFATIRLGICFFWNVSFM